MWGVDMNVERDKAIIGLVSVAIAHIHNGDIDKARNTLVGLKNQLEGVEA